MADRGSLWVDIPICIRNAKCFGVSKSLFHFHGFKSFFFNYFAPLWVENVKCFHPLKQIYCVLYFVPQLLNSTEMCTLNQARNNEICISMILNLTKTPSMDVKKLTRMERGVCINARDCRECAPLNTFFIPANKSCFHFIILICLSRKRSWCWAMQTGLVKRLRLRTGIERLNFFSAHWNIPKLPSNLHKSSLRFSTTNNVPQLVIMQVTIPHNHPQHFPFRNYSDNVNFCSLCF